MPSSRLQQLPDDVAMLLPVDNAPAIVTALRRAIDGALVNLAEEFGRQSFSEGEHLWTEFLEWRKSQ